MSKGGAEFVSLDGIMENHAGTMPSWNAEQGPASITAGGVA